MPVLHSVEQRDAVQRKRQRQVEPSGVAAHRVPASIKDNDYGIYLEGATAQVDNANYQGNNIEDVHMEFGTKGSFAGGNAGTVFCDNTVIVRGSVSCPSAKVGKGFGMNPVPRVRPERPERPELPLTIIP